MDDNRLHIFEMFLRGDVYQLEKALSVKTVLDCLQKRPVTINNIAPTKNEISTVPPAGQE